MRRLLPLACLAALPILPSHGYAASETPAQLPKGAQIADYVGEDVMIPMRDGVKLHAEVWRPKAMNGKLPVLLQRSPYGFGMEKDTSSFAMEYRELAQEGFIFVLEDIRGRFGSEGQFVMLRPKARTADGVDESTDSYDTIDWIVKSLPGNNARVGVFGVSYLGWTTAMATINPHPALKAVSVQASPEDMYLGDDFHHNGAFRLQYGWEYAAALETDGRTIMPFNYGKDEPYSWFLGQHELASLDQRALGRTLPSWRDFVDHPNYDGFWRGRVTSAAMSAKVAVPDLIVAGWWDQEDFYGPLTIYRHQEKFDRDGHNFIVIGPWDHGGWMREKGERYGPFEFGFETGVYFRGQVETPWFRYWLKQEARSISPRHWSSKPEAISGGGMMPGRRARAYNGGNYICMRTVACHSCRPPRARMTARTGSSPTPRIRFHTGNRPSPRSLRNTAAGARGWRMIRRHLPSVRMCCHGKRNCWITM